jgi:HAE1 family hydrophobic/amphiphilic exporter-1
MLTLPMGFLGVIFSLYIANQSFNIMSYIGIVMLGGIVVNNAIVLIDCINQIRQEGKDVREAILLGGQRRLRPILMTTLTTILALVPLALGIGKGAELRAPMAITVIGGLTTSTILTLFIIPIVYSINDDIIKFIKRIFSRSKEQKI